MVRLPVSYRDDPQALESIFIPTASGQRLPLTRLASLRRDGRPLDHPTRLGRAANRRPGERPGPRHRLVRRGGPGANRPGGEAPDRLHHRLGRPVRAPGAGREAALHRRAARPRPHPEPPLPHLPLAPGRPDDFQRRPLRPGRRRPRALRHGPAVHHLGRAWASSPWPGRRCSKGSSSSVPSATGWPEGCRSERPSSRRGSRGFRPVLMTGTVAALGFVPMMLSTGIGAEVQKPLATVVVFGMACDTFLTMLALPVLYLLFGKESPRSPAKRGRTTAASRHRCQRSSNPHTDRTARFARVGSAGAGAYCTDPTGSEAGEARVGVAEAVELHAHAVHERQVQAAQLAVVVAACRCSRARGRSRACRPGRRPGAPAACVRVVLAARPHVREEQQAGVVEHRAVALRASRRAGRRGRRAG